MDFVLVHCQWSKILWEFKQGEPEEEDVPVGTRSCGYSEKVGYSSLKITPPLSKKHPKKAK